MDGESWQLNLESWRERRRAAAKALALELQQQYDVLPQREAVAKARIILPENDMQECMRTQHQDALKFDAHSDPQGNIYSGTTKTVLTGLLPTPDAERRFSLQAPPKQAHATKYLPELLNKSNTNEKRPLPMRIRLMCHSDCVKADRMGMSVAALGDSDGPPFVIQDIVKDSMADKGHLEVGDELFSVDNLCCSFVADRPILVPTLAKLHQLLERLAKKQRPVEVKVFRSHDRYNPDEARGANSRAWKLSLSSADRVSVNSGVASTETTNEDVHKSYALRNDSLKSRSPERDVSEDRGITLVEIEKVHPVRGVQQFVPSTERVEAAYSDPEIEYTIPQEVEMASTVVTIETDIELPQSKRPEVMGVSHTVKAQQYGHSDGTSHKHYAQLLRPVSANSSEVRSFSSILEAATLPPTPPPPLSSWPLSTSPEAPPSICSIPTPPPSTPRLASSRIDQHPSISLLLTPPPSSCRKFATEPTVEQPVISEQELHPQFILSRRCRSPNKDFISVQQFSNPRSGMVSTPIDLFLTSQQRSNNEDVDKRNDTPDSTVLPTKPSSSRDSFRTDAYQTLRFQKDGQVLKSQNDRQYDSDIRSFHFEPNPSGLTVKSEQKIAEPRMVMPCKVYEKSFPVASDVGNDGFAQKKRVKLPKSAGAKTALLLRECVVEHKEPMDEVYCSRLPTAVSKGQMCTHHEEYELPEIATSGTKTETLMAEMVTVDTLQSLERHADFTTPFSPKSPGKSGQVTEAKMKSNDRKESASRSRADTRPLSSQTLGGPSQNRLGISPVRAPRVNVIGTWYTCAGCNQQLGTSDLMIIEQLSLFYHLSCFVCARCGIQLSDGQNETSVRIRNGLIYCYICYHRISKSLSRSKERTEGAKFNGSPTRRDRHSSLARSSAKIGQFFDSNPPRQSNDLANLSKR